MCQWLLAVNGRLQLTLMPSPAVRAVSCCSKREDDDPEAYA